MMITSFINNDSCHARSAGTRTSMTESWATLKTIFARQTTIRSFRRSTRQLLWTAGNLWMLGWNLVLKSVFLFFVFFVVVSFLCRDTTSMVQSDMILNLGNWRAVYVCLFAVAGYSPISQDSYRSMIIRTAPWSWVFANIDLRGCSWHTGNAGEFQC